MQKVIIVNSWNLNLREIQYRNFCFNEPSLQDLLQILNTVPSATDFSQKNIFNLAQAQKSPY